MGITIGIKRAIIPQALKDRVASLSDDTKELALAYLVAVHTPEESQWSAGLFHADLSCSAWEVLKDRGLKFEDT